MALKHHPIHTPKSSLVSHSTKLAKKNNPLPSTRSRWEMAMSPCVHRSSHGSACPNFSVKRCGRVLIANKQTNSGVVWWRTLDTIAHHVKHGNFCRAWEIGVERGLVLYVCCVKTRKKLPTIATATEPAGPRPRSSSPSLLKRITTRAGVRGRVPILFLRALFGHWCYKMRWMDDIVIIRPRSHRVVILNLAVKRTKNVN